MCLRTEADWLDMKIVEAQVVRVDAQVLRLDRHELWVEPRTEPLAVERLPPLHVMVVVDVFHGHSHDIRFDLANVKEHLVDLLVTIGVRPAQVVAFSNRLFHLQTVKDGESNVIGKDRLDLCVHALNLPQHPVEHLHVHAPLSRNRYVRVQAVYHVCWSQDGHIGADCLDLLLTNPLGAETSALRVRVRTGCGNIDEALDLRRVLDSLRDSHWHTDVGFLELTLLLVENMGADAGNCNV